jgi:hypothetical protein
MNRLPKIDEEKLPQTDKSPSLAFFVTWRIKQKNRNKDYLAIFDSTRNAAEFIVQNKKSNPDIKVSMAIINRK